MSVNLAKPFRLRNDGGAQLELERGGIVRTLTVNAAGVLVMDGTQNLAITGGSINGTPIGGTTASTGAFTNLSYTGTLTGGTGAITIGTNQFVKDASGNVGIGTTSPGKLLDVNGDISAGAFVSAASDTGSVTTTNRRAIIASQGSRATGTDSGVMFSSSDNLASATRSAVVASVRVVNNTGTSVALGNASSGPAAIDNRKIHLFGANGNIYADGELRFGNLGWSTDTPTGGWALDNSGGNLRIQSGTTERMRIDSAGNVGIGTSAPGAPLHVASTDSIIIPVGTTAQRAGVPVTGMARLNTSLGIMEYYDGTVWRGFGEQFVEIGTPMGGGYFAGYISTSANGVPTHYLIVAPKASGENLSIAYGPTGRSDPTSFIDGPANTATLVATDDAPAAQFCAGLTVGGFTDWYMPARYELDVLYFSLKPTNDDNRADGGNNTGINPNAVPKRDQFFTAIGPPRQTKAAQFRAGNSEQFEVAVYLSSSESSVNNAWLQGFGNGTNTPSSKASLFRVRAVRRIPI